MNIKKVFYMIIATTAIMFSLTACGNDDYEETLKSGYDKYLNGEEMSREEYNAVKAFNEWQDKQGEKTYSDWDN